ncbi:MASE1 domain-containing protein, partial [bacterium]|nr:MASE1 domain-containing protein [bacterium]
MSAPPPVAEPVASPAQDASQESRPDGRAAVKWVAQAGALFAIYVATALLGLSQKFDPVSGFATLVWAPTGLALAALVTSRRTSLWPAIALGAFAANMSQGAPPLVAGAIALGNTAEAVLGAFLLRRSGFRPSLERLRDVLVLIAFAAIVSTTVSATVG